MDTFYQWEYRVPNQKIYLEVIGGEGEWCLIG